MINIIRSQDGKVIKVIRGSSAGGAPGPKGEPGEKGEPGVPGPKGDQGIKISPRFVSTGRVIGSWSAHSLSSNSTSAVKIVPTMPLPPGHNWPEVLQLTGLGSAPSSNSEAGAFGQINIPDPKPAIEQLNTIGVWAYNDTTSVKECIATIYNSNFSKMAYGKFAIKPNSSWQFVVVPFLNFISNGLVISDTVGAVRVSETSSTDSWPVWGVGESILIGDVTLNPRGRATFLIGTDDGYSENIYPGGGDGYPLSGRTFLEIASRYGFGSKIGAYIVPTVIDSPGYLSTEDLLRMMDYGFVILAHSNTHPQNLSNQGLRLLGPYGYYLSQLANHGLRSTNCPVVSVNTVTNILTTSSAHGFLQNNPIEFIDSVSGITVGTKYYVSPKSGTTFSVSLSPGGPTVVLSSWTGTANYRYYGSAPDDSAIYDDIMTGVSWLTGLGFESAGKHFALPQGAWDSYVATAIERCGFNTVRGISISHSFSGVMNSGGGRYGSTYLNYGIVNLPGSIQIDGSSTLVVWKTSLDSYIDQIITLGGVGSCYAHGLSANTAEKFDYLCSVLKQKEKDGLIDILDMDEYEASTYPLS